MILPSARRGTQRTLLGAVACASVYGAEQTRLGGGVVDEQDAVFGDAGSDEAFAEGDADGVYAVGDLGPDLFGLLIDEPEAAAVGTGEVSGEGLR